ncbi:MAG TPA: queuosine salvage family protein [Candidatus Paceibacterota bacterium]|nr:queuosine salvage family protein [Candidatus Paceibacterota bacterium]
MNHYTEETARNIELAYASFRHVKIDHERLACVAREHALGEYLLPKCDDYRAYPVSNKAFISREFFADVINFCFDHSNRTGDGRFFAFRARTGRDILSGSYAMASRWNTLFGERPVTTAALRPLIATRSRFQRNFRGVNSMPLLGERFRMLHEACDVLDRKFGGDPANIVEEANYRSFGVHGRIGMVDLLIECFPHAFGGDWFYDMQYFTPTEKMFYFMKRAQLFALMYHNRAVASQGGPDALRPLADPEDIGPIADYILPKRYVEDGVLLYDAELSDAITRALPIVRHSRKEVEIRLAFVKAHLDELRIMNEERAKAGLDPIHVGHLDWHRWSRRTAGGARVNHHLCYTTDY